MIDGLPFPTTRSIHLTRTLRFTIIKKRHRTSLNRMSYSYNSTVSLSTLESFYNHLQDTDPSALFALLNLGEPNTRLPDYESKHDDNAHQKTLEYSTPISATRVTPSRQRTLSSRPSPPLPANDFPNAIETGNDGNLYISSANRNGVYRWIRYKGTK